MRIRANDEIYLSKNKHYVYCERRHFTSQIDHVMPLLKDLLGIVKMIYSVPWLGELQTTM